MPDKKLVIIATHGPEDPERATIPFVMATAAQASGIEVVMAFQSNAVMLAKKVCLKHVFASGFPPLEELVKAYIEAGGKMLLCGPCINSRKLEKEDFITGAVIVNAATLVNEVMSSHQSLRY